MNITPKRDIILIRADKPENQTKSGLLLNESWKTIPLIGEVVKVGPEVTKVNVGDRVLFERYASIILEDDMRLCLERHVFGAIDEA